MVHEDAFNALPLFDLPRNALCLDIGANCGQSIVSLKQVLPGARIEAFEPNPGLRAGLNRTAARFKSVNCHDFALGERSEHRRLYVPACAGILFHQLSSLERPEPARLSEVLRSWGFTFVSAENLSFGEHTIPIRRLDDLGLVPDFVKIDVEGAELSVLKGAEQTLRESTPLLMIEGGHRSEIVTTLSPLGYLCCWYESRSIQFGSDEGALNSFFVHQTRKGVR